MTIRQLTTVLFSVGCASAIASGGTAAITVAGTDAIFLAGRSDVTVAPAGMVPPPGYPLIRNSPPGLYAETFPEGLAATSGESYQFGASGLINFNDLNVLSIYGPDGYTPASRAIDSVAGISGYDGPIGALAGVFLADTDPANAAAPATIDFASPGATSFTSESPSIGEVFYVGDGLTGTGSGTAQTFIAPPGATRLFLGIPDGVDFEGPAGAYDDNTGSFDVTVRSTEVPEPTIASVAVVGLIAIFGGRRRRGRQT
jgi:hypothetical protein